MKFKKLVSLIVGCSLIMGLAGCGSKATSAQKSGIATEIKNPVTIEFWHAMNGDNEAALKEITDKFNEKNKGKITVKLLSQGHYKELFSKLDGASKAKKLPALTMIYPNRLTAYVKNGLVEDLGPYIENPKVGFTKEQFNDMPAFVRDNGMWDGKHYSLPFNKATYVIFYNKDLLQKNNVAVPTTWKELGEAAKKLTVDTNGDGKPDKYGLSLNESVGIDFSFWVEQAGGHLIDEPNDKLLFNSPATVEAYDFVNGMVKSGCAKLAGQEKYVTGPFGRGEAAMAIASTSSLPDIDKLCKGNNINYGTAILPKNKKQAALFSGTDVAIFNTAAPEEKLAAFQYLKYFFSKDSMILWGSKSGYLPLTYSAIKSDEFQNYLKNDKSKAKENAIKEIDYGFCDPKILNGYAIHDNMDKALQAVIQGQKDSKTAIADAEKKARQELDDAKKAFGK